MSGRSFALPFAASRSRSDIAINMLVEVIQGSCLTGDHQNALENMAFFVLISECRRGIFTEIRLLLSARSSAMRREPEEQDCGQKSARARMVRSVFLSFSSASEIWLSALIAHACALANKCSVC